MNTKQYVRIGEYSKIRSISKATLWRWVKQGKLRTYKIGAKITVLDLNEADLSLGLGA